MTQPGALTSLGAVGGPRGVGAGGTKILLQFITSYARGDLEKLAADLNSLKAQQLKNQQELTNALTTQKLEQLEMSRAKKATYLLDKDSKDLLASLVELQKRGTYEQSVFGRTLATTHRERQTAYNDFIDSATTVGKLNRSTADSIAYQSFAARDLAVTTRQVLALDQERSLLASEITTKTEAQLAFQRAAAGLQALLVGAVGGLIGGAVITTLLFEPLQKGLNAVSDFAQKVLDPAKQAREAIKDLGAQINGMVDDTTVTRLGAAAKFIKDIKPVSGQSLFTAGPLAEAGQIKAFEEFVASYKQWTELKAHNAEVSRGDVQNFAIFLEQQDAALGKTKQLAEGAKLPDWLNSQPLAIVGQLDLAGKSTIDWAGYLAQADSYYKSLGTDATTAADATQKAADAALALTESLSQTALGAASDAIAARYQSGLDMALAELNATADADIASIQNRAAATVNAIQNDANSRIKALQRQSQNLEVQPSARTKGLQGALDALSNAGPSARTQALQAQIDRLNKAADLAQYKEQLRAVNEEKRQLILKRSLELSTKEIDISAYSGQSRITALQVEQELLQRRNAAQDRFNKLLDIQYNLSVGVTRNAGESVQDFIARRAQYNRKQLEDAAKVNADTVQAALKQEQDRTQTEIDLHDLLVKRKKIIDDRAHALFLKRLTEELAQSRDHDQKVLEARRKALQEQLQASQKADQKALDHERQAIQDRIDRIRQDTQDRITEVNKQRDADIAARKKALAADIQAQKDATAAAIKAEQDRIKGVQNLVSQSDAKQRELALSQAKTLAQINAIAGSVAGSGYSANLLRAQAQGLGLQDYEIDALLANADAIHAAYQKALEKFNSYPNLAPSHMAQGGFFPITNGMNFGDNIRVGEEGPEIGFAAGGVAGILSNKIVQELRNQKGGGQPLVGGDMVINGSGDPHRDRYYWRKEVKAMIREELRN